MSPEYRITAHTLRRDGMHDPVGEVITKHLPDMGFKNVESVRFGAAFRFIIEAETNQAAREQAKEMFESSQPVFGQHYSPLLDKYVIESVRKVRLKKSSQT